MSIPDDRSFISLKKVIPTIIGLIKPTGGILALVKPQFEAYRKEIKKGVVLEKKIHNRICSEYKIWFENTCKMKFKGLVESPIRGPKGNIEFFIYCGS